MATNITYSHGHIISAVQQASTHKESPCIHCKSALHGFNTLGTAATRYARYARSEGGLALFVAVKHSCTSDAQANAVHAPAATQAGDIDVILGRSLPFVEHGMHCKAIPCGRYTRLLHFSSVVRPCKAGRHAVQHFASQRGGVAHTYRHML